MREHLLYLLPALVLFPTLAAAQCQEGESEVHIEVVTDDYGYELYWELLPFGSPCGNGTIFSGGNDAVGCNGAGDQQQVDAGYGDNVTVVEGPFCLTNGAQYQIFWADDWGDGGGTFNVIIDGIVAAQFSGAGATDTFTFTVQPPTSYDMSIGESRVPLFTPAGRPVVIAGDARSFGGIEVTSFDLNYAVDGGATVTHTFNDVSIQPFGHYVYRHGTPWVPENSGEHEVTVWVSNINGEADMVPENDQASTTVLVLDAIPQMIDNYFYGTPVVEVIADDDQDLLVPRDLDFHPDPQRNELWVINKDVENSGGSTVRLFGAGEEGMTWLWQRDPNAWHFMSLPTGIAFGDNNNFATSPGVFDANHNGGTPFTGPSLWDSDPDVYAQGLFGPLGSHIDMVHANPSSQGIAHDSWNRFWVVDGHNGDVVMNDFRQDHGPGQDDHNDAIIRRYDDFFITKDPNDHIVSHTVLDKNTGWLYVVDHGGQRVLRLDINTGTVAGPGQFPVYENYDEYSTVVDYVWEEIITEGLVEPAGIEVIGERLLVSDHATGEIIVYDLSDAAIPEVGRIPTGSPGVMGITVGPDGHIWFVNATLHQVGRIVPDETVGITEGQTTHTFTVHPVPANTTLVLPVSEGIAANTPIEVIDMLGRPVATVRAADLHRGMDISQLANGSYSLRSMQDGVVRTARFIVQH